MSLDEDLKTVDEHIEYFLKNQEAINAEEMQLNSQIAEIKHQIAKLKDARASTRRKIDQAYRDKSSIIRKKALEAEAEKTEEALNERRKAAMELLKGAPWLDVAYDWQINGAIDLPDRALIGDKRGLGKTLSALIWRRAHGSRRTLVCLRRSVASDFIKEITIREPKTFVYSLLSASAEERSMVHFLLNNHTDFIVVVNIESWRRNAEPITDALLKLNYDGLILDEAHNIKNSDTGTAQGFFRLAYNIEKVLLLTGTPIKNRPQEMFSLLHALYPDQFRIKKEFLRDFCVSIGQNKWAFSEYGIVNLTKKIRHFYIARTPEDVGRKIPPPRIIEYDLDMSNHAEQFKAYKEMAERSLAVLTNGQVMPIVSQLALMTRQAQMLSWPAGITFTDPITEEQTRFDIHQSVAMDWAEDLIVELKEEGERVVFFSRFKPAIYELKRRLVLQDLSVAVISGDENNKNYKEIFDDFDLKTTHATEYKYDVLLATYQTVGESANFNAATHMVMYDRFWNPGNEDQAMGRVDRLNSVKQATIHRPAISNSIDEYMKALIEEKRNLVNTFGDAAKQQMQLIEHLKSTI